MREIPDNEWVRLSEEERQNLIELAELRYHPNGEERSEEEIMKAILKRYKEKNQ